MSKTTKWADIKAKRSPESRARIAAEVERMEAEMPLHRIREALAFTQAQLAQTSGISQPSISQIEQRADVLVGTLERYLTALNVQLRLVATLPDSREIVIRLNDHLAPSFKEARIAAKAPPTPRESSPMRSQSGPRAAKVRDKGVHDAGGRVTSKNDKSAKTSGRQTTKKSSPERAARSKGGE